MSSMKKAASSLHNSYGMEVRAGQNLNPYQIISRTTGITYGVYGGASPEEALDAWAADHRWGSWKEAAIKAPDLFGKGFTLEEGFRILI